MTIYYVTPSANGSGDGLSISSPMTLAQVEAVATAGDEIRLCGSPFNLTGAATWAFDNTSLVGSENSPIVISGYAADGTTQAQVTIDGAGMDASTDIMTVTGNNWMVLNRITFANAKQYGFSNTIYGGHFLFLDCVFSGCVTAGCYTNQSVSGFRFYRCRLTGNGTGFLASSSSRGHILAVDCVFDHNTVNGAYDAVYSGSTTTQYLRPFYLRCKFYRNGGDGLKFYSSTTAGGIFVHNCTFFANGGAGINAVGSYGQIMIEDSILLDNTTYGIQVNSSAVDKIVSCRNLVSYGNTSGHIDINSGVLPGTGHVYENPYFVSETDGSENLAPTNENLKISYTYQAGGTNSFWIGAIQPPPPAQSVGVVVVGV